MKATERTAPETYTEVITADYGVQCFVDPINLNAMMYSGKSNKCNFHFHFRSVERLNSYVNQFITNYTTNKRNDEAKRAEISEKNKTLKASDHFKVGDIVYNSWGYDQTNVEFYQVIEVLNKKIRVRELRREQTECVSSMAANVVPVKDSFYNDKTIDLLLKYKSWCNNVVICNPEPFYNFSKWDGRQMYSSWYA